MAKFNKENTIKTVNKSGYAAYAMKDKEKLVTQVFTTFFNEEKYYGDNSDELMETALSVIDQDPAFVSKLARYARKVMHLRSVSHVLTAIVAHEEKSKPFIKETVKDVVERPDDITEILAFYLGKYGKPVPNGLKKALGSAVGRFDEYTISKYSGGKKSVKFIDVLRLTHVKPETEAQAKLFEKIVTDTLPQATRWETELSKKGNTKEVWEEIIAENRLGYMAMLRNLRNIINADPKNLDDVLKRIADKDRVLSSKQLPMRFFSAYKELCELDNCSSKVLDALETATEYSVENMPRLAGKTIIAIDTSGSMITAISNRSKVQCCDIARLLAVLASKICDDYIVYTFNTELTPVTFSSKTGILSAVDKIKVAGGGTDIKLPFEAMLGEKIYADRIILLSDNEINRNSYHNYDYIDGKLVPIDPTRYYFKACQKLADDYRKTINENLWVHAIDLMGYGTQQFLGKNTNVIAGWSERVIEFIDIAEKGIGSQVDAIENF